MLELGRWGLHFFDARDVAAVEPAALPNSLKVLLRPPMDAAMTVQLRSGGYAYRMRIANGWIDIERGEATDPDLSLAGTPQAMFAALVDDERRR